MQKNTQAPLIFSGTSHPSLAQAIASSLGTHLSSMALERFPDGEISLEIQESVRGRDVFVVQTVALSPNEYLMELLIIIDALRRSSAERITAVIPYFGYCRQDRRDKPRVPITARLVANMIEDAGADRILTMDLHTGQLEGFFDIPVDNLHARPVLLAAAKQMGLTDFTVVTPDIGSIKLARAFATEARAEFAIVDKFRLDATHVTAAHLIGDVNGKDVLLADDICSTGGTLVSAAKACHEKGARRICAAVTHALCVGDAFSKLAQAPIEALLVCDTIPITERFQTLPKVRIVSVAPLFAQAIHCVASAESISSLQ